MNTQIIDLRNLQKKKPKQTPGPFIPKQKKELSSSSISNENSLISWQAKEFKKKNKSYLWFAGLGVFITIVVIFAIITKSPLMALLFILIGAVLYLSSNRKQETLKCSIAKNGVVFQKKIYNWTDLESFWIFYNPAQIKLLSIKSKKTLMSYLTMPLENQNPSEIRKILLKYLP